MNQSPSVLGKLKRHKILLLVISLALLLVLIASRYSFITVEASQASQSGGAYSFRLTNQKSNKTDEIRTADNSIRRLVSKGNYEVQVFKDGLSSFGVVKAPGMLRAASIQVPLQAEKSRRFVGNNPSSCMYFQSVLYSYDCGGNVREVRVHVPATPNQPTISEKVPQSNLGGEIESIVRGEGGTVVLARFAGEDGGLGSQISYGLRDGFQLTNPKILKGLDNNISYFMVAYKSGYLAYAADSADLYYYPSPDATPELLTANKPPGRNLAPSTLEVSGDTIYRLYSSAAGGGEETQGRSVKNQLVLSGAKRRTLNFDGRQYSAAKPCGTQKICLLSGKDLFIYDIAGNQPKLSFSVSGVSFIQNFGNRLLAVRQNEVLNMDVDSKAGYSDISLADYEFCGLQTSENGYVLCLINSKGNKVALLVDPAASDTDSIDKKIAKLLKLPEVNDISAYGQFVFIVPELGELAYDPAVGGFGYNQEAKGRVASIINQEINRLGIDRSKYTLINTLE